MPELPEVETVRRDLSEAVTGATITGFWTDNPKMLRGADGADFGKIISGAKILSVERRAKHLLINLSNNKTLISHLKMTGQMLTAKAADPTERWTHAIINLKGGRDLRFKDIRKFGYIEIADTAVIGEHGENMPDIGPEPLDRKFTKGVFDWLVKKHPNGKIKALLLDQSFIAGIGNIYADEILFFAGVRPTRRAGSLTAAERDRIYNGIRKILAAAIEKRGSSINTYVDASGNKGGYVPMLKAYGREGLPCLKSGCGVIKKTKVAGRSTHYCPKCQK
jgi:formamidopyrimidine-DNA glycosylase